MASGAARRGLLLWVVFVVFCAFGMAYLPNANAMLPAVLPALGGRVTYFQAMLLVTAVLGLGSLLRLAGDASPSVTRTMCRVVVAYLLFELLVVFAVAIWMNPAALGDIVASLGIRITWLLFPVMVTVCSDERARRLAGVATAIAAAGLVAWGVYAAATGRGGYYVEFGEVRYRVLSGTSYLLVAWPFVLAASGAAPRRYTAGFLVLTGLGLALIGHRSDVIACAVAGSVCLLMSGRARRFVAAMVPIALVATIIALIWGRQVASAFGYTVTHLFDFGSGNGEARAIAWRRSWDFFSSYPLNDWVWSWRIDLASLPRGQAIWPHNFVLEVAVHEGVVGLAFLAAMFWNALRNAWSWGWSDAEARAIIGWLVAYLVFSFANANHYLPTSLPLLVGALAALASRVDGLHRASQRSPDAPAVIGGQA